MTVIVDSAASILCQMCGLRIQVKKIRFFFREISEKCRFFLGVSSQKFDFPGKNFRYPFKVINSKIYVYLDKMSKFASYNWADYSIYLQKSPLSNIIKYKNNISRPPATPSAHNLGVSTHMVHLQTEGGQVSVDSTIDLHTQDYGAAPVWYENLSGVVSCPENI